MSKESQFDGLLSKYLIERRQSEAAALVVGNSVLDLGCGYGDFSTRVSGRYLGIDSDPSCIGKAQQRYPQQEFRVGDITCLDDSVGKWDTIVALAVAEHLSDPLTVMENWTKFLNVPGRMVITTPVPYAQSVLEFGAFLGLFHSHVGEDHQKLLDRKDFAQLNHGLRVASYRKFEFGLNQLVALEFPHTNL